MRLSNKWLVGIIVVIAFVLRIYNLGSVPPSLSWDEVAWGYNAYSLGIDGRDEFGRFLPIDYLESYGDFKPPIYAYLTIIPVKLFGLTPFATRFASAFFGTFTVLVTYFLVKRLFDKSKQTELYALFAAGFLAISPWHINLSRAAFEANVASFFIICGVWLFLEAVAGKKWLLIVSAISFVLSLDTFNTARIVSPLLVLVLIIFFWKQLFAMKKEAIIALVIGILLLLPSVPFLLSQQASLRFREVNIFSDNTVVTTANQEIANDHNAWWSKIIHNRRLAYGVLFIKHYLDHFNPTFLFISGDVNPRFSTQDVGQMYLWDVPFFVLGFFLLFKKREKNWWIIPLWLFIGIIPAATARETPHALRIETALPTFQIITAYGFVQVIMFVKTISTNTKYKLLFLYVCTGGLLCVNVLYYLHGYYLHYAKQYSNEWQYGYKEAVSYAYSVENAYEHIYVTDQLGRPYIYFLFYGHILPQLYREQASIYRDSFGFVTVQSLGKYHFERSLPTQSSSRNLYINVPSQVPGNATVLHRFKLLNDETALVAYTL